MHRELKRRSGARKKADAATAKWTSKTPTT